jgi:hypothetical protein
MCTRRHFAVCRQRDGCCYLFQTPGGICLILRSLAACIRIEWSWIQMPSEPSDFVAGILEPLATVLILKREFVTPGEREKWARDVLEPTTSRYCAVNATFSSCQRCQVCRNFLPAKCRLLWLIENVAIDSRHVANADMLRSRVRCSRR